MAARGPEFVVDLLLAHLQARIPTRLAALRAELALSLDELPEVASWHHPRDVGLIPVEEFPAVMVAIYEAGTLADQGSAAGGREYLLRYRVRVYVMARAEGAEETGRARSRYLLAAREALLAGVRAPLTGPAGLVNAPIDASSYRESYSEIDRLAGAGTVGAAYAEAELTLAEILPV